MGNNHWTAFLQLFPRTFFTAARLPAFYSPAVAKYVPVGFSVVDATTYRKTVFFASGLRAVKICVASDPQPMDFISKGRLAKNRAFGW